MGHLVYIHIHIDILIYDKFARVSVCIRFMTMISYFQILLYVRRGCAGRELTMVMLNESYGEMCYFDGKYVSIRQ